MPWLWDDRSEQAIPSLARGDRYRSYPLANAVTVVRSLVPMARRLHRAYEDCLREAFGRTGRTSEVETR